MSSLRVRVACGLCLDTARCWVCEGRGTVQPATVACSRCAGSGLCRHGVPLVPVQRADADPQ